jgi:hypothetical protein
MKQVVVDELARVSRFRELLAEWEKLAAERPIFRDGYLEEIRPNSHLACEKRHAASEERDPQEERV